MKSLEDVLIQVWGQTGGDQAGTTCYRDVGRRGPRCAATQSVCVSVGHAVKHGKKNDLQVEADAPVAEVVKIVLNAFGDGSVAAEAVDLGPSGDSGFDIVS